MIPIEEVKKVAEEKGAKLNYRQFNFSEEKYLHGFETLEQLQAFAQHYIEEGRKMQREMDKYIYVVANRTGSQVFAEEKDADEFMSAFPASIAGGLTKVKVEVIRNNTGE